MDDMKDKVKGFMKKVNNPFSSTSSGKFKGQGTVLGSSSSAPRNSILDPKPPSPAAKSRPLPQNTVSSEQNMTQRASKPVSENGFDPFDSLVTSGKRTQNGCSLNVYACPICGKHFRSEEEVSVHVDGCLNNPVEVSGGTGNVVSELGEDGVVESRVELEVCVGTYVLQNPAMGSIDVVLKLLRNVVREPESDKFRRIRMSNPRIKEAVGDVAGAVELLSFVGFEHREENGETWMAMEVPTEEQIQLIKNAIALLESQSVQEPQRNVSLTSDTSVEADGKEEPKKIHRQVKVFFAVPESIAAKIELPESFYKLSDEEVRKEAELRRKKIADSAFNP